MCLFGDVKLGKFYVCESENNRMTKYNMTDSGGLMTMIG